MKKIICIAICTTICCSIIACRSNKNNSTLTTEQTIRTTETEVINPETYTIYESTVEKIVELETSEEASEENTEGIGSMPNNTKETEHNARAEETYTENVPETQPSVENEPEETQAASEETQDEGDIHYGEDDPNDMGIF